MSQAHEALYAEIIAAFADRDYPKTNPIAYGIDSLPEEGGTRALRRLRGKTWHDVLAEGLESEDQDLPRFLTHTGWLYYFPAFAKLALDPSSESIAEAVVHVLQERPEEISYRVSPRERRAIVRWLEVLAERLGGRDNSARQALDEYWGGFLEHELDKRKLESRMARDVARLSAELASAFATREYPGDNAITNADSCGDEAFEAQEWLLGKTWQNVLAEGMSLEHRDLIHFLSQEAWLYYFPAFAIIGLDGDHPAEMDNTLTIKLAWWPQTIAPLVTPAERRAIADVLAYWAEVHDRSGAGENLSRYALETHWSEDAWTAGESDEREPPRHDSQALQQEIQSAFAERERPDGRSGDAEQFSESAADEADDWLRGKSWREVLAEGAPPERSYLIPHLTAKAWLYYFPAFATLSLEPDQLPSLTDMMMVKLTFFPQQIEPLLTPSERRTIIFYLEYWADAYARGEYHQDLPGYALRTFWEKHAEDQTSRSEESPDDLS